MTCPKCEGLMIVELGCLDVDHYRCINCGNQADLAQRTGPISEAAKALARSSAAATAQQAARTTPKLVAARQRNRLHRLFREGKCRRCRKRRLTDSVFCRRHRDANRKQAAEAARRKKRAAKRLAA